MQTIMEGNKVKWSDEKGLSSAGEACTCSALLLAADISQLAPVMPCNNPNKALCPG